MLFVERSKCVMMTLPDTNSDRDQDAITVIARGSPDSEENDSSYTFEDEMKVAVISRWHNSDISFMQTDKPIYKPGQLGEARL